MPCPPPFKSHLLIHPHISFPRTSGIVHVTLKVHIRSTGDIHISFIIASIFHANKHYQIKVPNPPIFPRSKSCTRTADQGQGTFSAKAVTLLGKFGWLVTLRLTKPNPVQMALVDVCLLFFKNLLAYSWFTILCLFQVDSKVNQLHVYLFLFFFWDSFSI